MLVTRPTPYVPPADVGLPQPTQWVQLETASGNASAGYIRPSTPLWSGAAPPAYTVSARFRAITAQNNSSILSDWAGAGTWIWRMGAGGASSGFMKLDGSNVAFTAAALGDINSGNWDNHVVLRYDGTETRVWANGVAEGTAMTGAMQANPAYGFALGSTGSSSRCFVDCRYSNACAWVGTALTDQQCLDISLGNVDGRSLSPTNAWLLDGDTLDQVGGNPLDEDDASHTFLPIGT